MSAMSLPPLVGIVEAGQDGMNQIGYSGSIIRRRGSHINEYIDKRNQLILKNGTFIVS